MLLNEEHRMRHKEMMQSLTNIQKQLEQLQSAIQQGTVQTVALLQQQTAVMTHHFGMIGSALQNISHNTGRIAAHTQVLPAVLPAIAATAQVIAHNTGSIADASWSVARNTQAIANDTWDIAGHLPQMAETLTRQAWSLEYANWHRVQFQRWCEDIERSKSAGSEMFKNPLFPNFSSLIPLSK